MAETTRATPTAAQMTSMLESLKMDLEIITDFMDESELAKKEAQLQQYLNMAVTFIQREGAILNFDDDSDTGIVVMYAAWLYDKRKDPTAKMPQMVRYNLNNKIFSEKMKEGDES
ncbi:MAG: hypothetical protein J6K75_03735 [Erysipelotrichaceae bacterium]|nr:hypothetical protein [Erysipelotrichaceae bacterium]